jgi:hypothetical protein
MAGLAGRVHSVHARDVLARAGGLSAADSAQRTQRSGLSGLSAADSAQRTQRTQRSGLSAADSAQRTQRSGLSAGNRLKERRVHIVMMSKTCYAESV